MDHLCYWVKGHGSVWRVPEDLSWIRTQNRAKSSTHSFWASIYKNNTWSWSCELCARVQLSGWTDVTWSLSHAHTVFISQDAQIGELKVLWCVCVNTGPCTWWMWAGLSSMWGSFSCFIGNVVNVQAALGLSAGRTVTPFVPFCPINKHVGINLIFFFFSTEVLNDFRSPGARALLIREQRSCSEGFGLIKM